MPRIIIGKVSNSITIWTKHFFRWSSISHKNWGTPKDFNELLNAASPEGILRPPSISAIVDPRFFVGEGMIVSKFIGRRLASVIMRVIDAGSSPSKRNASMMITAKTSTLARLLVEIGISSPEEIIDLWIRLWASYIKAWQIPYVKLGTAKCIHFLWTSSSVKEKSRSRCAEIVAQVQIKWSLHSRTEEQAYANGISNSCLRIANSKKDLIA